ncbi:hypothetical protein BpHYR1_002039 [Brachionus plicatilis]|uniref:Uncharacterized protein n=1 Tax=Brachionus plicatilis TaxID=10195 RepID=A0A3M7PX80_BRAPC|nr:hypothetical protein BpHYR1_002039 [Brachionus plicatilis]
MLYLYLVKFELLMNDYQDSLERIIKSNMIVDNPSFLSDIFLDDFDLDLLESYIFKNTWQCDKCNCWYHFDCANVTNFYRTGKGKNWYYYKDGLKCSTKKLTFI